MLRKITHIGLNRHLQEEERNRIVYTNTLAILPIFLSLFYIGLNLYFKFYPSLIVSAAAFVCLIYVLWLNKKFHYRRSRYVLITTISLYLLVSIFIVKQASGVFFFYPVVLLSFFILFDHSKEMKDIFTNLAIVGICMTLCIFIPKNIIPGFDTSGEQQLTGMFVSKILVSCSYIFVFINVVKYNFRREKILREAKEKAEAATTAKAIFLSNMSHELRTPLNGIVGINNLLKDNLPERELKENLNTLSLLSDHMLSLVNDILDFSQLETRKSVLNTAPLKLSELFQKLNDSFVLQFRKKQIDYTVQLDPVLESIEITADELRLRQVLFNLISNALKFTPEHGTVTLSAFVKKQTELDTTICFAVKDTGIGIAPELQQKIFESFTQADVSITRKHGGSGLGLSIVQFLIQLMNSNIELESVKDKGSTFSFTASFPYKKIQITNAHNNLLHHTKDLSGKKILLADDNPTNVLIAKKIMERWGIEVSTATNGQEAVEQFQTKRFDILLIDLEMPVMDGKTATRAIRNINTSIPIIAFTAAVYESMDKDLLESGFNLYLLKPFNPEKLKQTLCELLVA